MAPTFEPAHQARAIDMTADPEDRTDLDPIDSDAVAAVARTLRLWGETLLTPWRVFPGGIRPGEQLPAIIVAILVTGAWVAVRVVVDPGSVPVLGNAPMVSVLIWAGLLAVVVAPLAVHVMAALATVVLIGIASDRAGVSETVQTVAFAMAPAPVLATGVAELQVLGTVYGSMLLVYGLASVHRISLERALLAAAVPAYVLFVIGFGADAGFVELMRRWYII